MGERKGRGESRKKFPCPNNNYMLSTSKIRGVREDPFYSLQDIRIHYVHLCALATLYPDPFQGALLFFALSSSMFFLPHSTSIYSQTKQHSKGSISLLSPPLSTSVRDSQRIKE